MITTLMSDAPITLTCGPNHEHHYLTSCVSVYHCQASVIWLSHRPLASFLFCMFYYFGLFVCLIFLHLVKKRLNMHPLTLRLLDISLHVNQIFSFIKSWPCYYNVPYLTPSRTSQKLIILRWQCAKWVLAKCPTHVLTEQKVRGRICINWKVTWMPSKFSIHFKGFKIHNSIFVSQHDGAECLPGFRLVKQWFLPWIHSHKWSLLSYLLDY